MTERILARNPDFWTKAFLGRKKSKRKLIGKNPEDIFMKLVSKYLDKHKTLLDIGTGKGKTPCKLASKAKEVWGVDPSRPLIAYARKHCKKNNVRYVVADGRKLPFNSKTFDVIMSQRGPVSSNLRFLREAFRIIKNNGKFIEITIGEKDKSNIKRIFKRGQNYECVIRNMRGAVIKKKLLETAGFKKILIKSYESIEYLPTKQDLILRLLNTPIIPHFDAKKDHKFIERTIQKYKTKQGIKTNSHRLIILAEK